ncbi:CBL-interacting serine/threonine-protein kinase 21-like isoform X3 [Populus nigra]|uniref:CBL-interacting serine/threonine-protein kinase 21-like isoform X3 n=1 Tax=Populus nigra TaxID=3691 RepID=UPI002B2698A4|nr:CBL-interacting serine/threonine-protein kinase 21-like isoform X3 [Populus nigra]
MGHGNNIGKYQLGRTIGEGTFAKVKLAVDSTDGRPLAIKIMDKKKVMQSHLKDQREIRAMKLLHHPGIVRIHEVIGTKTKIYMVMEYVSGGQLADKLSYAKKLRESEARRIFHQLMDAVDSCHNRGVYHRDLKPENLLLDGKGNLKVSDFGLSALQKTASLLTTTCGSPFYIAPELIANKGYEGAAADVWSCGVILFELLSGYLPFDERNLIMLYKKVLSIQGLIISPMCESNQSIDDSACVKISAADYTCPQWFTESQKKLISRILDPNPRKRITLPEILEDEWFQIDYVPSCGYECDEKIFLDDVNAAFDADEVNASETETPKSSSFINAFQLIAMSHDLDLSGLFEEQAIRKQKTRLGSKHTVNETIRKIEAAAMDVSLSVERMNNFKMKMHQKPNMKRYTRSYYDLSAEVIEVAPMNCVVEISKSVGETRLYKEFCKSLSSLLTKISDVSLQKEGSEKSSNNRSTQEIRSCEEQNEKVTNGLQGYSSS